LVRRHLTDTKSRDFEAKMLRCAATPFDLFSHDQDMRALQRAILSLPISYREVVVLCDIQELDYQAAARQLSCAVGTIRSRLHRARAILARKLRPRQVSGRGAGCVL
jgi:RNA polymerase sigma-70 factor (ECF subfamily)